MLNLQEIREMPKIADYLFGMKKQHRILREFICELLNIHGYKKLEWIKRSIEHEMLDYCQDTDPLLYHELTGNSINIYRLVEIIENMIDKKILRVGLMSAYVSARYNKENSSLKHNSVLDYGLNYLIETIADNRKLDDERKFFV